MPRTMISWLAPALASLLLCTATTTQAASRGDVRLDGEWRLDATASDDFDASLARMADAMRAKMRSRRGPMASRGGPGGYGATDEYGQVPGLVQELPPESRDELHERLADTYRPPARLRIRSSDSEIAMLGDAPPERHYNLAETVTRMDVSGTATLKAKWSAPALVVVARYTNRTRSEQRYAVDRTGNALTVTLQYADPIGGKLQLRSIYRRINAPAAP